MLAVFFWLASQKPLRVKLGGAHIRSLSVARRLFSHYGNRSDASQL